MAFAAVFVKRDLGELIGLPTPVAFVLLVGVPIIVIGSTAVLLYYCFKARSAKRKARNAPRPESKSSHHTIETDHEMGLTSIRSTGEPSSIAGSRRHSLNHPPPISTYQASELDRQFFAAQVYGVSAAVPYQAPPSYGSEPDAPKYEDETPSPITIPPQRPKTAPSSPLDGVFTGPVNVNRLNYGNRAPLQEVRPRTSAGTSQRVLHRRSKSLDKPAPIRISTNRPTHSPAGSLRSLSVFPHRHVNPSSPGLSPTHHGPSPPPHHGPSPPVASPSPPLISPVAGLSSRKGPLSGIPPPPPPPPPTARSIHPHVRHPSMDRNSLMPIAPILLPFDAVPSTPTIVRGQEQSASRQGRKRGNSHTGNYI